MNRVDQPADATSASLTKLLAKSGPYPGSVVVLSGLARRETDQLYHRAVGWWGRIYTIDAPPPGRVLWFSFFTSWQIWNWNCYGPYNDSNTQLHVDFGISWRWELIANPFFFPEPLPRFMTDFGRHEFYSSVPPGGSGFDASWILPSRTVTLTPDSKESDPTPLQLLLATNVNGNLRLWWRGTLSDAVVNGHPPSFGIGGSATGWPGDIYWSCAVELPRVPDVGPVAPVEGFNV
jgi:hypothetical protein